MSIFRETKLSIKSLQLWSENPRFPEEYFGKPENELINYIVSIPLYKIKEFAKEVVEDFDMPVFEKLAIFDGEGENITVEGNRRLTVYKLLVNPELCDDPEIQEYFHKLKRSITITNDFKIDCVISDNKKEILRYVNRKHLNNNNEARWGTLEQVNAKYRWLDDPERLDNFKINLQIIIRNLSIPTEAKNKILGRGFVTTLFRILNSRTAAQFFQLVFNDDHELVSGNPNFIPSLIVIIGDILEGKEYNGKKFSRLNAAEVEQYLKSITVNSTENSKGNSEENDSDTNTDSNPNDEAKEDSENYDSSQSESEKTFFEQAGNSGATAAKQKAKSKKSTDRKHLIPKDCKLNIRVNKINHIFIELQRDLLLDDSNRAVPNAVSVLFRVFLESSVDHYAERKHGNIFKADEKLAGKITWAIEKLKAAGHDAKIFKHANLVATASKEQSILSIQRFHQYVHDGTLEAGPTDLKQKWDLLQGFFEALWSEMK